MKTKRTNPNNLVFLNRDRGYRFVDSDPVLVEIRDLIHKSGLSTTEISLMTAKTAGMRVATSTINNWLNGKTRKPQNFTVTWVGYVLGWQRGWHKI